MRIKILLLITLAFVGFSANASEFYPEKQAIKLVSSTLKEKDIQLLQKLEVKESLSKKEPIIIYPFKRTNSAKIFYAVFTQAKGRYDLFDYLLITSNDFVIEKVNVLKYRSEHGGEIASKKWLEQFENYSSGDLNYGDDISALSGATVSANSLTIDIPKVLEILKKSCK